MPKIRKKTSKRQDTHTREKVKKKISDAKKKAKKLAKKDVTWKSNKPEKDLGIPSKFPFKDQILQEAADLKAKREEEKKTRREAQKAAHQAASLGIADPAMAALAQAANANVDDMDNEGSLASGDDDEDVEDAVSSSLKLHAKSLREVIEKSDVIVQVLDARDPNGTRSRKIERETVQVHGKKLVLVLNKIDLVPRENVESWLKHLRLSFPTLPFKSSTQAQRKNLSSGQGASAGGGQGASSSSPAPLLTLLKNYSRAGSLTIGVIGFPNVGKSSLINTLKRSRACGVAPTPGFTKDIQIVALDGHLKILDCPGVVYEGGDAGPEQVLRNATKVEQVEDPIASVEIILQKCKKEHLMMLYNIPAFDGIKDFLIAVARVRGRLKKGGVPDLFGTARSILRDWNAGRIAYYTVPPINANLGSSGSNAAGSSMLTSSADVGSAAIMTTLAPEFNFDDIFAEADSGALADIKSSREMGPGGAVRMNGSLSKEMEVEDDGSDAKFVGEGEGGDMDDDEEEEEEDEEVPMLVPTPSTSKKASSYSSSRKRTAATVADEDEDMDSSFATTLAGDESILSRAPSVTKSQRRVTFDTAGAGSSSAQKKQMFAGTPDEEPIALNKSIKQAAKKQKKQKQKQANRTNKLADDVADSLSSMLMGSSASSDQQQQQQQQQQGEAKPYDFAKFFGAA